MENVIFSVVFNALVLRQRDMGSGSKLPYADNSLPWSMAGIISYTSFKEMSMVA